ARPSVVAAAASLALGVAGDPLPARRRDLLEAEPGRPRAVRDRQRDDQDAVPVGDGGTRAVDRRGQVDLAVVRARAPLVEEDLLGVLERAAQLAAHDEVTLRAH